METMKDGRCIVCKFKQSHNAQAGEDLIYDAKGNAVKVPLCYEHSVDLYKVGQISFVMKYNKALREANLLLQDQVGNR